jgi:inosose dehydratase
VITLLHFRTRCARLTRVSEMRIANAPCSWGVMKGFEGEAPFPEYSQVLDEIAQTGYEGTELGDWGFMPTDPEALKPELARRGLRMVGALVPLSLADPATHESGLVIALRTARLLAACAGTVGENGPFVILADDNGANDLRTQCAGRIREHHGMSTEQWRSFTDGANRVARAVLEETAVRSVFHHHCAGFVETPEETERLLDATDPALLGLCFDTGHWAYAGGDPLDAVKRYGERIWHVHFKDCHVEIAERAQNDEWDYFRAVREGVFYGLGQGDLDFASIFAELQAQKYQGWIVVEDELPPGMGEPLESAQRDREYLRGLGV